MDSAGTARALDALQLIARRGCDNFTSGSCCIRAGRTRGAEFTADAWCDPCVAADALGMDPSRPTATALPEPATSVQAPSSGDLLGDAPLTATAPAGPWQSVYVHFECKEDMDAFARLVGQPITMTTPRIRFPVPAELSETWIKAEPEKVELEDKTDWNNSTQNGLFGNAEWWEEHWQGMPEFDQKDLAPWHSIQVDFESRADVEKFSAMIDQPISPHAKRTRSVWYPEAEIGRFANKRYVATTPLKPRHPVYVISKGRWENPMTARHLKALGVPFKIVVEPQEVERYAAKIDRADILALPFSNRGQGSIPARNWCWEHAVAAGAARHWILDDNIDGFYRLNRNLKTPVSDGTMFRVAEDFVERYENVAIAGFHYFMFASRKTKMPPFTMNSRVYSMILIRNDLRLGVEGVGQWRGRYNEDTDLSLRALKSGEATVLFAAFLGFKTTTMTMAGGNSDELYAGTEKTFSRWEAHAMGCTLCSRDQPWLCDTARKILEPDGRWRMAMSLYEQHPEITAITRKWGRWQHDVDYSGFKRIELRRRPGLSIAPGVDNYGMMLHVDGKPEQ